MSHIELVDNEGSKAPVVITECLVNGQRMLLKREPRVIINAGEPVVVVLECYPDKLTIRGLPE